jgi:uncharacterized protein
MSTLVSNTSPLVALSAVGQIDLLRQIFDEVIVLPGVYRELVTNGQGWQEAAQVQGILSEATWMRVANIPPSALLHSLLQRLGAGEAEAIAFALQEVAPVLLDDLEARKIARGLGVEVIGSLGVLARSKKAGRIQAVKPIVEGMRGAGIYYSDLLLRRFLEDLDEAY